MKVARTAAALSGVAVVGCALVAGASPASAGSTAWVQAIERFSAEAACPTSAATGPAPQSGWVVTEWAPSWEAWANGGRGGWTCTRTILWGRSSPAPRVPDAVEPDAPADPPTPPASLCYEYIGGSTWLSFASGNPIQLPANIAYGNADCTGTPGQLGPVGLAVYAVDGPTALGLCQTVDPSSQLLDPPATDPNIWLCVPAAG